LAAGADLFEVGAWIIDPKGGLMCFAAGDGAKQQQQLHSDEAIIWAEAHATMASRASLTAEMQAKHPSCTETKFNKQLTTTLFTAYSIS
jgi:hypothetical protein